MWHYIVIIKNIIVLDSEKKKGFKGWLNEAKAAYYSGIAIAENELDDRTMRIITYKKW